MRLDSTARVTLALVLGLPVVLPAQAPRPIGRPEAEFKEPFTRVATVRELEDGRLLVVDERENTVRLIDFRSGAATQVGRTGAGPREYGYPGRLLPLPGGSSVLHDPPNGRYLIIGPDGTPGETFRLGEAAFSTLGSRGSIPRATDAYGAMYFEGSSLPRGRAGAASPSDSVPVMRYDRRSARLDTIAWVRLGDGNVRVTRGADGQVSVRTGAQAFAARDDWAALPAGGIAVARVRDYHVDWYPATGARSSGRPIQVDAIAVTEAEKEAWRAELRSRVVPRGSSSIPVNLRDPEWPTRMPPFVFWQTFSRPNGELWVLRSHRASENPVYDVFTAPGTLAGRVELPAKTRLVGFGNGTVYLVRRDDDDFEYVQRYRLP